MSVASTTRKQQFTLNGVTAAFTFTFRALTSNPSDIKAIVTSGGNDTNLTYTTDFSIAINANGVGGTITLVSPASWAGTLTVYRDTTNLQSSDYDNYNQFNADTLETDLDIRTLVSQEQAEALNRTLILSISSSGVSATLPSPVASAILGWASDGLSIVNALPNTGAYLSLASQAQAQAGTDNVAYMSALRVAQAITALQTSMASAAEALAGSNNTKFMTPSITSLAISALSITAATQAQQEAATVTGAFVSPGRQQYHPSAAKAWVSFTGTSGTLLASYNISTITRTSIGVYAINFIVPFSSANYSVGGMIFQNGSSLIGIYGTAKSAGTCHITCRQSDNQSLMEVTDANLQFYGDQA